MSNSPSLCDLPGATRLPEQIWVRLCGPLLLADDDMWCENPTGTLPRSAPHEREVVDHLYELERLGAHLFVYDPILASNNSRMTTAAQEYLYANGLNAWVVPETTPPEGVEVIAEWPLKTTSTPDSTPVTNRETTSEPSSAKSESSA